MIIDHIQLAMPAGGEDMARSFFVEILGMVEDDKPFPLNQRGGVWFRHLNGTAIIHLGVEEDFRPQKKAHPAFLIDDLDSLATKLSAARHSVQWDDSLTNRKRFFTDDPFGNRIEFIHIQDGFSKI